VENRIFDHVGEEGFTRLVAGFYARVRLDPVLAPLYPPDDWEGAEERLRDFLIGRFGGPQRYVERRGHPRLRMRHAPFPVDKEARDRWMAAMEASLAEADLDPDATEYLRGFFAQVATFLQNR
jgi:hemoglobin